MPKWEFSRKVMGRQRESHEAACFYDHLLKNGTTKLSKGLM